MCKRCEDGSGVLDGGYFAFFQPCLTPYEEKEGPDQLEILKANFGITDEDLRESA